MRRKVISTETWTTDKGHKVTLDLRADETKIELALKTLVQAVVEPSAANGPPYFVCFNFHDIEAVHQLGEALRQAALAAGYKVQR
jgi:hypothetical protein